MQSSVITPAHIIDYTKSIVYYRARWESREISPAESRAELMRRLISTVIEHGDEAIGLPGEGKDITVSPGVKRSVVEHAKAIRELLPLDAMRLGVDLSACMPYGNVSCRVDAIYEGDNYSNAAAYIYAPVDDMSLSTITMAASREQWHITAAMCKSLVDAIYTVRCKVYFAVVSEPAEAGLVQISERDLNLAAKIAKTSAREIERRRNANEWGSRWKAGPRTISISWE